MATFLGINEQTTNFMSAIEMERLSVQKFKEKALKGMDILPKMRYAIVEVLGDYYYKDMNKEEALEVVFTEIKE